MIELSNTKSTASYYLMRAVLAVTLAMPLGCSGGAAKEDDSATETPLEVPQTLRITVRNDTNRVQYLDPPDSWMRSASDQVATVALGYSLGVPALYTNQPDCAGILSGVWACGDHGDTARAFRALAPGAEYIEEWDAQVWQGSSLEGAPDCQCMAPVEAPAGDYLVSFGVSSSVACSDVSCPCQPGDSSCVAPGALVDPVQLERPVTWPDQGEVLIVLE
jgi:hypothetical protein